MKNEITGEAAEAKIDLTRPDHEYTLWLRNGAQLLFRAASVNVADLYADIGHYCLKRAMIFRHTTGEVTEISTYIG